MYVYICFLINLRTKEIYQMCECIVFTLDANVIRCIYRLVRFLYVYMYVLVFNMVVSIVNIGYIYIYICLCLCFHMMLYLR